MTPVPLPRMFKARRAAEYLGVSETTFRGLGIRSLRVGGNVLYDRLDLDAWIDAQWADQDEGANTCDAAFGA